MTTPTDAPEELAVPLHRYQTRNRKPPEPSLEAAGSTTAWGRDKEGKSEGLD